MFELQVNATSDILTQAQSSGDPTVAVTSLILSAIGLPAITLFSKYINQRSEEKSTLRSKAMANTLVYENESLEETDKANLDNALLLKRLKDDILKNGKPSEETANAIEKNYNECKDDIQAYYTKRGLPKSDLDVCNDPIIKQVNEVKQRSIKNE